MADAAAGPKVGGRFWALASDEDDEDGDRYQPEAPSPSPSDLVCESILAGYSEEQVANSIDGFVPHSDTAWVGLGDHDDDRIEVLRRVVHRRTSSSAVRPWKGPIPKVHARNGGSGGGTGRGGSGSGQVAEAAVTRDTETLGTIGTTVLEVQVVAVASGTLEEVQGELLISGTDPFSLRKALRIRAMG
ncbi:hypothetical protein D1007_21100 [Hordeum vulgare]|nr:hypothetical protein D1007_21100 [Hordeum vulgare]